MSNKAEWIHCKDFQPTRQTISCGERKELDNGSYRIPLKYDGKRLWMETYRHRNPFGLSRGRPNDADNFNKKVTCTLSFDNQSARGNAFLGSMKQLQELLIDIGYEHRVDWGLCRKAQSASVSRADIAKMMNPIVRVPMDEDGNEVDTYPPTFRVELYSVKDEVTKLVKGITTEVYDQAGSKVTVVDESTIPPGSEAKVIMGISHIYVQPPPQGQSTGKFGVTLRLHQLRVFPGASLPTGRCLIQDDPDSDVEDNTARPGASAPAKSSPAPKSSSSAPVQAPAPSSTQSGGGDDEDEDEEEEAPKPAAGRPRLLNTRPKAGK